MKHARITRTTAQPDGSAKIETKSYLEELNTVKEEIQQKVWTTKQTLLKDVVQCLDVITLEDSKELTIGIRTYKGKLILTKTWTVKREHISK